MILNQAVHALVKILESIAAEEDALAKIVGAEADKVRAFVEMVHHQHHPQPTVDDMVTFNVAVNRLLITVLAKEIVLLNKLDVAAELLSSIQEAEQKQLEGEEPEADTEEDNDEDEEENGAQFP